MPEVAELSTPSKRMPQDQLLLLLFILFFFKEKKLSKDVMRDV